MPTTLAQARIDILARLDSEQVSFWTPTQLNTWINEALRDIARRTETLMNFSTEITAQQGQAKYPLPPNIVRVHRVEYVPIGGGNNPQTYPMQLTNEYVMDQRWGTWQTVTYAYPSWAIFWGNPPNLTMQVYPTPSQQGHFNVWYYAMPDVAINDSDVLDVVEGWWDLVSQYVEYVAMRKDRDDRWSDSKDIYEANLENMIEKTRFWHDQPNQITRAWEPATLPYGGGEWL